MKPTLHEIPSVVTRPKRLQQHREKGTQTKPGKALSFVFHSEKFEAKNVKFEASETLDTTLSLSIQILTRTTFCYPCVIFLLKKLQLQNLMFRFISTRIAIQKLMALVHRPKHPA